MDAPYKYSDADNYDDFHHKDGGAWTTKNNKFADRHCGALVPTRQRKGWSDGDSETASAMTLARR